MLKNLLKYELNLGMWSKSTQFLSMNLMQHPIGIRAKSKAQFKEKNQHRQKEESVLPLLILISVVKATSLFRKGNLCKMNKRSLRSCKHYSPINSKGIWKHTSQPLPWGHAWTSDDTNSKKTPSCRDVCDFLHRKP